MERVKRYYEYRKKVRSLPVDTDVSVMEKADRILQGMRENAFTERMNEILANTKERGKLSERRSKIFFSWTAEDYQNDHRRATILEALANVTSEINLQHESTS